MDLNDSRFLVLSASALRSTAAFTLLRHDCQASRNQSPNGLTRFWVFGQGVVGHSLPNLESRWLFRFTFRNRFVFVSWHRISFLKSASAIGNRPAQSRTSSHPTQDSCETGLSSIARTILGCRFRHLRQIREQCGWFCPCGCVVCHLLRR